MPEIGSDGTQSIYICSVKEFDRLNIWRSNGKPFRAKLYEILI